MQNGQYGAIVHRVQKFVGVPTGGQRSCLRFSVADRYGHDEVGIGECGPEAMGKAVTEFAALVNRSRGFRSAMAADASRKRKLLQELVHPFDILTLVRINLRIHSFEITVGEGRGGSMPRT